MTRDEVENEMLNPIAPALHEILELRRAISGSHDPAQIGPIVADRASRIVVGDAVLVLLRDDEGRICAFGGDEKRRALPITPSHEDPVDTARAWTSLLGMTECVAAPLAFRGDVIGAIAAYSLVPRAFDADDKELLSAIADLVVVAIAEAPPTGNPRQLNRGIDVCAALSPTHGGDDTGRAFETPFRALVDNIKDYALCMLDPSGRITTWNTGAERITGYSADEAINRYFSICYAHEDILMGKAEMALAVAKERGRFESEEWCLRKNGSRFWATIALTAIYDAAGRLCSFSKVVRDTTEQKLMNDVLRESSLRTAAILDSISDAFCSFNRDWRFTFVNAEAERVLGQRRPDIIGRQLSEVLPDLHTSPFYRELSEAMGAGVRRDFEAFYPPSGRAFEVHVFPSNFGISVYLSDITRRRRDTCALELLADTGQLLTETLDYEETLDAIAKMAVPKLADGCLAIVDDGGERRVVVAHADPAECRWWKEYVTLHLPLSDAPYGLGKALRTGEPHLVSHVTDATIGVFARNEEHLLALKRMHMTSFMVVPLRARQKTLGAIMFASNRDTRLYDSTDLTLAEEIGRRAALAVDNARLYRRARASVEAREALISIAACGLRDPVAAIRVDVKELRGVARQSDLAPPSLADGLEKVERRLSYLQSDADYLVDVARFADGELNLRLESVDAGEVVRGVLERIADRAATAGCSIALHEAGACVGFWDRPRLEQIVTHLLSNAMKYGPGAPVEVNVESNGDVVELRIRDRGPGISDERRTSTFGEVPRGGRSPWGGFRLTMDQSIVQQLGGTLRVQSAFGAGTTFTLRLPCKREGARVVESVA